MRKANHEKLPWYIGRIGGVFLVFYSVYALREYTLNRVLGDALWDFVAGSIMALVIQIAASLVETILVTRGELQTISRDLQTISKEVGQSSKDAREVARTIQHANRFLNAVARAISGDDSRFEKIRDELHSSGVRHVKSWGVLLDSAARLDKPWCLSLVLRIHDLYAEEELRDVSRGVVATNRDGYLTMLTEVAKSALKWSASIGTVAIVAVTDRHPLDWFFPEASESTKSPLIRTLETGHKAYYGELRQIAHQATLANNSIELKRLVLAMRDELAFGLPTVDDVMRSNQYFIYHREDGSPIFGASDIEVLPPSIAASLKEYVSRTKACEFLVATLGRMDAHANVSGLLDYFARFYQAPQYFEILHLTKSDGNLADRERITKVMDAGNERYPRDFLLIGSSGQSDSTEWFIGLSARTGLEHTTLVSLHLPETVRDTLVKSAGSSDEVPIAAEELGRTVTDLEGFEKTRITASSKNDT